MSSVRLAARRVQSTIVVIHASLASIRLVDIVTFVLLAARRVQELIVAIRAYLVTTCLVTRANGVG